MKISNPLTIIAIFAGLAESLATIALVQLPLEIQSTFVGFVMFFPTLLIFLFFIVLFFKPKVLYAPSDFENQSHYLEVNDMKNSVDKELDQIFTTLNKSARVLSEEEINQYKFNVKSKIDTATSLTRREEILEFLSDGDATTQNIFKTLDIHPQYTMKILRALEEDGLVIRFKKEGSTTNTWKLKA